MKTILFKLFNILMFRLRRHCFCIINDNNNKNNNTNNNNINNNTNNNPDNMKKVLRFRSSNTLILFILIVIVVIMNLSKQNCIVIGPTMMTNNDIMMINSNDTTNEEEYRKLMIKQHNHWNELNDNNNSSNNNNTYIHEHLIPNRILLMHKYNLLNTTIFAFDNITNITKLTDIKDLKQRGLIALQRNVYNIIQHHPHAIIEFMTDIECIKEMNIILTKHYNATYATQYIYYFQNEKHGMFRGDICRAIVLYEYGGIYYDADLDVRYNSFHNIKKNTKFVTISGAAIYQYWFQAFIGVVPYHPVMKRTIELFYMYYNGTFYTSNEEKLNMNKSLGGWPLLLGPYLLKEAFFDVWKEQRQQLLQLQNNSSLSILKDDYNTITDNNVDPSLYYNMTDLYETSELWYEILYYKEYINTIFVHVPYPGYDIFITCRYYIVAINRLYDLIPIIQLEENIFTPTNRYTLLKSINEYYINEVIIKWLTNQMDLYKMNQIHNNPINDNNQQRYSNRRKCHNVNNYQNNKNNNNNSRINQRRDMMNTGDNNDNNNNNQNDNNNVYIPIYQLIPVPFGSRIRFSEECSDLIDINYDDETSLISPISIPPSHRKRTFINMIRKISWISIKRFIRRIFKIN